MIYSIIKIGYIYVKWFNMISVFELCLKNLLLIVLICLFLNQVRDAKITDLNVIWEDKVSLILLGFS